MVSSTLGSPTNTCWKRRSSAGSFSIRSRYSSSVVAPIMCSSPRASIGLSMLPASIAESPPAPAPTTVCSSSMKVMIWPPASLISSSTALSRSSNSPRYFAPATIAARSRLSTRRPLSESGTSPATTRWASPSTTAVLPTPGSPISTGLFLVRRRQHLHHPPDLGVAADHRVEPALLGGLREVDGVLLQRLVRRLRLLAGHPPVAADRGEALAQPGLGQAGVGEQLLRGALGAGDRDQQVLGGDVVVLHDAARSSAAASTRVSAADAAGCWTVAPLAPRQRLQRRLRLRGERGGVDAGLGRPAWRRCPSAWRSSATRRWIGSVAVLPAVVADSCAASIASRLRVS